MRIDAIISARANDVAPATTEPTACSNLERFHDRLAAVRAHTAPAPSDAPLPAAWSPRDAEAFAVFVEANRRTESGAAATFSTLRTTAGAGHRASFGVAQLSIREHLGRLARQSDAQLTAFGTTREEVHAMRTRGDAAVAFYHLVVDGRERAASASTLGLDTELLARIEDRALRGDAEGLRALVGARFTETTGLPTSGLDELLVTRALRDPALRDAFQSQFQHDHGVAFDPAHRDRAAMTETAQHLVLAHPELARALEALGGDSAAATSLAHYLGVGDSAENLLGWHARAASSACTSGHFGELLARADLTTSRARELDDFERALAAVARIGDLDGDARVATLARLGRIFHGAPTRARETLFVDGRLDAPRCHSRAQLDALLDDMRSGRTWSDARLAARVAEVVAERRTS